MKKISLILILSCCFFKNPSYSQTVTTYAGSTQGYSNGNSLSAQFYSPFDVCVNALGTVYVTDQNNTIREISTTGIVNTLAGNTSAGYIDGPGNIAQFYTPNSICVDLNGTIYVADYNNNKIRKITPEGIVSTLAGSTQGYSDGIGTNAQFFLPQGVCVDLNGNVYVADGQNNMIRKITPEGLVTTLAGSTQGYLDGDGSIAKFNFPTRVCVDNLGNVYVTDSFNNKIRKISPTGFVTTLAGSTFGFNDGIGSSAQFRYPMGICVDQSLNVYLADGVNNRIRKITSNGFVSTLAGSFEGYQDGNVSSSLFFSPTGVCIDASGNIYVTDRNNYKIRKITSTLATEQNSVLLKDIKIYPNPSNGIINIDFESFPHNTQVYITDLQGKKILTQQLENLKTKLDISNYSKGIYFVNITEGNKGIVEKIIVE